MGKLGMGPGVVNASLHSHRRHSRMMTSRLEHCAVSDAHLQDEKVRRARWARAPGGCERWLAVAQRQPAQAQWWTAGHSHRSPPSHRRAESRHANMHRIASLRRPSELNLTKFEFTVKASLVKAGYHTFIHLKTSTWWAKTSHAEKNNCHIVFEQGDT